MADRGWEETLGVYQLKKELRLSRVKKLAKEGYHYDKSVQRNVPGPEGSFKDS